MSQKRIDTMKPTSLLMAKWAAWFDDDWCELASS
jgi:hypothetical protein